MSVLGGVARISSIQVPHVYRLQQGERDLVIFVDLTRLVRANSCALVLVLKLIMTTIIAGNAAML